jgi:hypothetical protein
MRALLMARVRPKPVRGQGGPSRQPANETFQIFQYWNSILIPRLGGSDRDYRSSSTGNSGSLVLEPGGVSGIGVCAVVDTREWVSTPVYTWAGLNEEIGS